MTSWEEDENEDMYSDPRDFMSECSQCCSEMDENLLETCEECREKNLCPGCVEPGCHLCEPEEDDDE